MRKVSFGQHRQSLFDQIIKLLRFNRVYNSIAKDSVVVDLGCGYHGELLSTLAPRIKKGIGIDLKVSPKPPARNIILKNGKVDRTLPINSESCDLVTALAIIEHVNDPQTLLKEAFRILKKGGRLIITTPSAQAKPVLELLAFRLHLISSDEISDHKRYYSAQTLKKALTAGGFQPKKVVVESFELGMNLFVKAVK